MSSDILHTKLFDEAATGLAQVGRFFAERGWSSATSSNYSMRLNDDQVAITRTSIDKYAITPQDIIVIDLEGRVLAPAEARSSAETLIHTAIYKKRPTARCVLHTHSARGTRLSLKFADEGRIAFTGYEMQKGLGKNSTHESEELVPILPNSQDMVSFAKKVEALLDREPNIHGFLMAGHGLYTWGDSLSETRRHVEVFEFLFECKTLEIAGV